jgi:hypothetical protein
MLEFNLLYNLKHVLVTYIDTIKRKIKLFFYIINSRSSNF